MQRKPTCGPPWPPWAQWRSPARANLRSGSMRQTGHALCTRKASGMPLSRQNACLPCLPLCTHREEDLLALKLSIRKARQPRPIQGTLTASSKLGLQPHDRRDSTSERTKKKQVGKARSPENSQGGMAPLAASGKPEVHGAGDEC